MQENGITDARKLRSGLNHPIVDADGHWLEYAPIMREGFRRPLRLRRPRGGEGALPRRRHLTNAVRFWGEVNPDFFKGTAVEKTAAEVLSHGA